MPISATLNFKKKGCRLNRQRIEGNGENSWVEFENKGQKKTGNESGSFLYQ
jgi:hypothetical protein